MNDLLTIIIVIGVIVMTVFATKRYISRLGKGCCGGTGDQIKVRDKNINHYPFHIVCEVEGMHCSNCAKRIENAFNSRGDTYCKANRKTGEVSIYLKEDLEDRKIISIIATNGYTVNHLRR